jgi:hypothetical protein
VKLQEVRERTIKVAEEALADRGYVSPIDILVGLGMVYSGHVDPWRRGTIDYLLRNLQGTPEKVRKALSVLREWALAKGLQPSETAYVRATREGTVNLIFQPDGDPDEERIFRTHYVSPSLGETKQAALKKKLETPERPTVFQVVRDTECSECGFEVAKGELLYLEAKQALCIACAKMDDLEFLPAGDTALTRRATKYSARSAVVVRFSRSRGRYERQGILVETPALARAEAECAADAGERAEARARAAVAREKQDVVFTGEMATRILALFPACPPKEAYSIAEHAALRGSGRVGRSAAGRELEERAITLAVIASVRHRHTNYDELLGNGVERETARMKVRAQIDKILDSWR